MTFLTHSHRLRAAALACAAAASMACSSDTTGVVLTSDSMVLTSAQVGSLDSTGQVIVQANPGNPELKSLVDSTLLVLTAGVTAKRLAVTTNLTTAPLFFVGVHRAFVRAGASSSTWSLVGFDDPAHLTSLVEVSGFAQNTTSVAPTSVNGTIGDGLGFVNALMLQVAAGGAVTEWRANTGTASFSSDAPGTACPGFVATAKVTCALETMHVHFAANAAAGTGGAGARSATVATDVDVPAMRLTFTP